MSEVDAEVFATNTRYSIRDITDRNYDYGTHSLSWKPEECFEDEFRTMPELNGSIQTRIAKALLYSSQHELTAFHTASYLRRLGLQDIAEKPGNMTLEFDDNGRRMEAHVEVQYDESTQKVSARINYKAVVHQNGTGQDQKPDSQKQRMMEFFRNDNHPNWKVAATKRFF